MKVPTMSHDGEGETEKVGMTAMGHLEKEPGEQEFPCGACEAVFVTKMSLIRHMILHEDEGSASGRKEQEQVEGKTDEDDDEDSTNEGNEIFLNQGIFEEAEGEVEGDRKCLPPVPEQNLLETILKNGSQAFRPNGGGTKKPIPNLKPLPSLIQIKNQSQSNQAHPEKNFQCHLCGVWFWKKEDLSRHVTRTHGSAKFTCPYCQRNISRRDHLKRHIKNVHPEYCTATEVGPFVNQGAGRPPKPRDGTEEPQTKRAKMLTTPVINDVSLSLLNVSEELTAHNQFGFGFAQDDQDSGQDYDDNDLTEQQNENGYSEEFMGHDENAEFQTDSMGEEEDNFMNNSEQNPVDGSSYYSDQNECDMSDFVEGAISENDAEENVATGVNGGVGISGERKFKCELCDAAFMSKINMQRHMSTHSVIRPHKCTVCGKGFLRKEHLTKHLSSVHSGLKYRCQFCRKDISRKDHLLRHIRNCHPQEFMGMSIDMIDSEPQIAQVPAVTLSSNPNMRVAVLSCDMCSEIFNHVDELAEHQSDVHSDVRKFKCEECPKAFKRKEHLVKHMSTHSAKSFGCSECNKVFPNLETAHAHLREAHGQKKSQTPPGNKSPTTPTSLPCNLCDNTFQQRAHLLQHLKAYHGVSNPERRFLDSALTGSNNGTAAVPQVPKRVVPFNGNQKQNSRPIQTKNPMTMGKPQIRSLLGINNAAIADKDEGSLGSLMGLISKGSISLSLSKVVGK